MDIWKTYWRKYVGVFPDRISSVLRLCKEMELTFPNIYCSLKILGTIPVTTCECERSISSLRRLKTYLRSTMGEERLNGLAALHVHNNIPVDLEKIIDNFARKHSRRMTMINILDSDMPPDTTKNPNQWCNFFKLIVFYYKNFARAVFTLRTDQIDEVKRISGINRPI